MTKTEKVQAEEKYQEINLEGVGSSIKTVTKNLKYIATVPLKIDGVEIKIGEEVENFDNLRERTKRVLINLKRVKVVN